MQSKTIIQTLNIQEFKPTKQQRYILFLLYKFRFLTTTHIQKILNHKNPTRIQSWLKILKDYKYIHTTHEYSRKVTTFADNTIPFTYFLGTNALKILKKNPDSNPIVLDRIYEEKKRREPFIKKCLSIADMYLFFLNHKESNQEINFLTESELRTYDFLPDPYPDGYIVVTSNQETKRYFLDIYDANLDTDVLHPKIKRYIHYVHSRNWEANADGKPFPKILFVCETKKQKYHVIHYVKGLLDKEYGEDISIFVASKDSITNNIEDIWQPIV